MHLLLSWVWAKVRKVFTYNTWNCERWFSKAYFPFFLINGARFLWGMVELEMHCKRRIWKLPLFCTFQETIIPFFKYSILQSKFQSHITEREQKAKQQSNPNYCGGKHVTSCALCFSVRDG